MGKHISAWQTAGFLFASVFGTFLHFLYDLTGQSLGAALFSAVNESIWEHMKLIYFPMLIFALIEYRAWGKETENFWCVKLLGVILALVLIPVLYYSYTGMLGMSSHWVNIAIFFLAAGVAYWMESRLFEKGSSCPVSSGVALSLLLLMGAAFVIFTFCPPRIPFFQDPVTGEFGRSK